MRSREGQFSDARPIQRSKAEKERLLRELRDTLASLKPHASASMRTTLQGRIRELEADLGVAKK
ncbi:MULTISPECIES: hypothetical protein [Neoroseomonas]|uniref:Uncharacterized protein n=2 Tax=Neoroseomonas TaxID=2870716 RepID=A0A9X9WI72_9PROT|nr:MULTISPECIES: hypothetical protein [Neoroseomonas]MBR0660032.1 hypothetical protein [Neoroseomonas oryzicola]NKE20179.1 hypothetical protein [Neoroseomonas oryzicola]NMJ43228.1 hypothetical protein [Neoroseomonas marina]